MEDHDRLLPKSSRAALAQSCLLALLASAMFFSRLDCPLLEPEEARYAEIPRQMLVEGRLVVPVLNGTAYLQKPPLLYWLVMGAFCVFGPHDWAARLVPGIAGVLTVLVVFWWGRRALGKRAALLAGLVLCLSPRFIYLERMLGMDCLLCLWVTAAVLLVHLAISQKTFGWRCWLLAGGAVGLGILTKGPVALALVVSPALAVQIIARRRISPLAWLVFLGTAAVLAGPWYLALLLIDPHAAADFFWLHNVVRFAAPFDHVRPWWFYLPGLVEDLFPWTLVPLLAFAKWIGTAVKGDGVGQAAPADAQPGIMACRFLLVACAWCLLFFSASGCKRPAYLLPGLPFLALLLGRWLDRSLPLSLSPKVRFATAGLLLALTGLLLHSQWQWLPAHHESYSLRQRVQSAQAVTAADAPVCCYPHRWDSIGFYLHRDDIEVYDRTSVGRLIARLQSRSEALVFVKRQGFLDELRAILPANLQLTECGSRLGPAAACLCRKMVAGRAAGAVASGRIVAPRMPGMASANAAHATPGARQRAVFAHRLDEILAATGMEATNRR
jgi:hypothetical protein